VSGRVPPRERGEESPVFEVERAENDGAGEGGALFGVARADNAGRTVHVVWLPDPPPANDERGEDQADAALAADPAFDAVCDARRDAWIESMERDEHDEPTGAETTPAEERDDDECT
jgi:hypothetical protein